MATIELRLNSKKPGNYAFFCPVTKLHLTIANPVGFTDRVSNYILRGLKSKTLIDVNSVVDLETGNVSNVKKEEQTKAPELPPQVPPTQEPEGSSQAPEAGADANANVENTDKTEETQEVNADAIAPEAQSENNQSEESKSEEESKTEDSEDEENESVEEETTAEAKETKKRGRRAQN